MDLRSKFNSHVLKRGIDKCWLWTGYTDPKGYGRIHSNGRIYFTHRVALELAGIPVPGDKLVCHTCDNPTCVNPKHLYVGTHKDNAKDKVERGRARVLSLAELREKYLGGQ